MKYPRLPISLTQVCAISTLATPSLAHRSANKTKQGDLEDLSPWIIWPGEEPVPLWDGEGDYNDWESKLDFIEISALAQERTQQDVRDVCKSFDFTPSVENFYLSGAMDWLEKYTLTAMSSNSYRERGIVGSIAYDYLGDNGFRCGLGATSLCRLSLHISFFSFCMESFLTRFIFFRQGYVYRCYQQRQRSRRSPCNFLRPEISTASQSGLQHCPGKHPSPQYCSMY